MSLVMRNFMGLATFIRNHSELRDWAEKEFVNIIRDRFLIDSADASYTLEVLTKYIEGCREHHYPLALKSFEKMRNDVINQYIFK